MSIYAICGSAAEAVRAIKHGRTGVAIRDAILSEFAIRDAILSDEEAKELADAVCRSYSLQSLELMSHQVTYVGRSALNDAFRARPIAVATVWMACAPSGPVWLFFQKDGDSAVWSEVASFLA